MTTPPAAAGTSTKLLIFGGASAGVGLLLKLIVPLTFGAFDKDRSYDSPPWETERFGAAFTSFLGTPGPLLSGGVGLADLLVIFGAAALALSFAVKGFEPNVPKPAPQAYPQQYGQPGQYGQQPPPPPTGQYPPSQGTPYPPQPGTPPQQQWGG